MNDPRHRDNLAQCLADAVNHDPSGNPSLIDLPDAAKERYYRDRNAAVLDAMFHARHIGYPTGFGFDANETGYVVAYIELPGGQVSWHLPAHTAPWDGHDTSEKIARVSRFIPADIADPAETTERPSFADFMQSVFGG